MPRLTKRAPLQSIDGCRCCGSPELEDIIAFGDMPIADHLKHPEDSGPEYVAPLTLAICSSCGLCQILETVDPEVLFGRSYPYFSSVSPALVRHFADSANALIESQQLTSSSLVVEAASNDGYMLEVFAKSGIPVLGIDPAEGPVQEARRKGINTRREFFGSALAKQLASEGITADLFIANNVLAHVADTNGFVAGIETLLAEDGVAVLEFPYLLDLVSGLAFDTIYHQHLLYLSVHSATAIFERNGLHINDVERISVHGGSLRITVSRDPKKTQRLKDLMAEETRLGLNSVQYFGEFRSDLLQLRDQVRRALAAFQKQGKTVAGYGAAAKATTLLGFFGLTRDDIGYIFDKSPWKQGLEMPVTNIPIIPADDLGACHPDIVVILAWNFAREIMSDNKSYMARGGKFVVPVPEMREVSMQTAGVSL